MIIGKEYAFYAEKLSFAEATGKFGTPAAAGWPALTAAGQASLVRNIYKLSVRYARP